MDVLHRLTLLSVNFKSLQVPGVTEAQGGMYTFHRVYHMIKPASTHHDDGRGFVLTYSRVPVQDTASPVEFSVADRNGSTKDQMSCKSKITMIPAVTSSSGFFVHEKMDLDPRRMRGDLVMNRSASNN